MSKRCAMIWVWAAIVAPGLAWAALGEPEATVREDAAKLKGDIKSSDRAAYRIHEIALASGTVLREFVSADGKVFAVAWSGPSQPNLSQLLGRYFETYTAAAKAKEGGRTRLDVRRPEFVMHSGGHMRAFTGHAYLPQAVPAGVTAEELR